MDEPLLTTDQDPNQLLREAMYAECQALLKTNYENVRQVNVTMNSVESYACTHYLEPEQIKQKEVLDQINAVLQETKEFQEYEPRR